MISTATRLQVLGDLGPLALARSAALVALLLLGAAALGRALRMRLIERPLPAATCLDLALGLGIWGLVCTGVGLFVGVSRQSALVLLLVLALCGAWSLRRAASWFSSPARLDKPLLAALLNGVWLDRLLALLLLFVWLWNALSAISPEIEPDALSYHLQLPRLWLEAGAIGYQPDLYMSGYPLLTEALYWPLWALAAPLAAKWLHLAAGLICVLGVIDFTTALRGRRAGLLAGLLPACAPGWIWSGATANADLFLSLFVWAALILTLAREADPRLGRGALALAGLCLGLALNTKLNAVQFAAPLFVLVAGLALRRTRLTRGRRSIVLSLPDLLAFGLPCLALFALWPLRNLWFGIPAFFPAAADPLRQGCETLSIPAFPWCAAGPDCQAWCADSALVAFLRVQLLDTFGMGKGIDALLLLPWNLTFQPQAFGGIPLGLAWLPLCALLLGLRRPDVGVLSLLLFCGLGFVLWALGTQQSRLLLPLLPAAAMLLVAPLADSTKLRLPERSGRRVAALFSAITLAACLAGLPALYPHIYPGQVFRTPAAGGFLHPPNGAARVAAAAHNDAVNLLAAVERIVPAGSTLLTSGLEEYLYTDLTLISPAQSPRAFAIEYELRDGSCDNALARLRANGVHFTISRPDEADQRFGRCAIGLSERAATPLSPFRLYELALPTVARD